MIYDPAVESLARPELHALQQERLRRVVRYVSDRVAFYRRKLDDARTRPECVQSLGDLGRLPFTSKADLRDEFPFGAFAVPPERLARIHASTGTTGRPVVVGYTGADLLAWSGLCARALCLAGARPGQMFQNAYGYGLFTGGLGMHAGAERLGLTVIPASGGNTSRQVLLLRELKSEILACTPSYALTLAEALTADGIAPGSLALRTLVLGAEPWTEAMRAEIESRLGVDAVDIYGLSEVIGPGVACECAEAKAGAHIAEDQFIVEVIDPATGEPRDDGERGELVFTTLHKEAMPLIRYRTGDLASVVREPCRCGRTLARMSRVAGRTDDMLIIRGVNIYPSQVGAALAGVGEISSHWHLVVTRPRQLDELEVQIEVNAGFQEHASVPGDAGFETMDSGRWGRLTEACQRRLREALGLNVRVTLVPPGHLPRSDGGKLRRVTDRRDEDQRVIMVNR